MKGGAGGRMSFESFPQELFKDSKDAEVGIGTKLKNLFFSTISAPSITTTTNSNYSDTSSSVIAADIATPLPNFRNQLNQPKASTSNLNQVNQSNNNNNNNNGIKRTRTLKLSISSPSTRLDLVNSKGDLVQSSSRSIYGGGGGGGSVNNDTSSINGSSPNLNDSGFALTSTF